MVKAVVEGTPGLDESRLGWGCLAESPSKTYGELDPELSCNAHV